MIVQDTSTAYYENFVWDPDEDAAMIYLCYGWEFDFETYFCDPSDGSMTSDIFDISPWYND